MFLFGCDMFRFEVDLFLCATDMFPFGNHMFLSEADIGFSRKSYVSIVTLVGSSFARRLFKHCASPFLSVRLKMADELASLYDLLQPQAQSRDTIHVQHHGICKMSHILHI